jgi:membrane protease YdiL (CAAX protease family)
VLAFFTLTYVVTWTCFIAASLPALAPVRIPLFYLGVFAPSLVALSLTYRAEGREGTLALLRRLIQWRVGLRWYVFAIGYIATIKLTVAVIHRLALGAWPRFGTESWAIMLAATLASTLFLGQAGEEIGWRGYALPRLLERFGFARAAILLGVIWACWHLPLFFIKGPDTYGQSFPVYLLQVTAMSVAIAWLYVHTNGSLLLTMLMHAAVNNTKDIVPSAVSGATNPFALSTSPVAWLTVALLWICAGIFIVRESRRNGAAINSAAATDRPYRPRPRFRPSAP